MSQPQYMRDMYKDHKAPSSIIVTAEAVTEYVFVITKNENQFPKSMRYSVISQLQNECLKINKHVYAGNSKKPRSKEDFKRVEKHQKKTYEHMMNLKALVNVSLKVANMRNFEHMATLYLALAEAYARWVHNTRRQKSKAKRSGLYTKKERKRAFEENRIRSIAGLMARDSDGYIILKKREGSNVA